MGHHSGSVPGKPPHSKLANLTLAVVPKTALRYFLSAITWGQPNAVPLKWPTQLQQITLGNVLP